MITFKSGVKGGGGRTGVVLHAESSQSAIGKFNELSLLGLAVKPPAVKTIETPGPAGLRAPEKVDGFYSDGSRMERWRLWVSSVPMSFMLGLGFYLYFAGAPEWIAGAVMLAGFVVFGLAGLLIEHRRLKAFACPRCRAAIQDWDTNEEHRILFNCSRCESSWAIEYKLRSSRPVKRNQRRRSDFSTLCSSRRAY